MQKRSRLSLEDPLPLPEMYRQRHIKLAPRLITDWQRVAVALDLLIRAGEIIPGKFSSCTAITTLLIHRTTTFDKTPEVYRKSLARDVLDAIAPADSRARRRHNAIIDHLGTTRLRGRDLLPSPAAQARDAAAREELGRLAVRLPDGLPDNLPVLPVSLRQQVEKMEINPEMVKAAYAHLQAEAESDDMDRTSTHDLEADFVSYDTISAKTSPTRDVEPVEPGAHVEKLEDTGDEDLEDTGDEDLREPDGGGENPDDTRDVVRTTEEKLADILAAGRTPDPARELDVYRLWLRLHPPTPAALPAERGGVLSWFWRKARNERP